MSTGQQYRPVFLTYLAVMVLIMVSSCDSTATVPEPDTTTTTITMISGSIGREFTVLEQQIAKFEASHPHIEVQLLNLPESSDNRYELVRGRLEQQDSSFDVFVLDVIWPPEFGANGWTVPLNDYIEAENIDMNEFLPGTIKVNTWQDEVVALPWFTDVGMLFYRQDLLAEFGFDSPESWDELVTIAETILAARRADQPDLAGIVYQGAPYEGLVVNYLEHVWSHGGAVLSEDGQTVILNSQESVEALQQFSALQRLAPSGIRQFTEEDALNYFKSGNAIFMRNWPYAWAVIEAEDSPIKGTVGIIPLPSSRGGTPGVGALGGWQLAINKYSQHPQEAFELIAYLTSEEQQDYKAIEAGQNPALTDSFMAQQVVAANPHMPTMFVSFLNAHPRPVHPRYIAMSKVIQEEVTLTLEGAQTAEQATLHMSQEIQTILDEYASIGEK